METSKKILFVSFSAAVLLSLAVVVCTSLGLDCTSLTIVAGASWTELAVHTAVYSKKATAENRMKIAYGLIQKLSREEKFEPDVIVQLFDGVTKEG